MGHKRTKEGIQVQVASMYPPGLRAQHVGVGDDVANGTRYGDSDRFHMVSTAVETKTFDFQFIDPIYVGGGQITSGGQSSADWVSMTLRAPATTGTSNPGSGAYDKVSIGGGVNKFTPNADTEGDWDLNLTEKHNANVDFLKVVPVPAVDGDGWFDYDHDTHVCAVNAGQKGDYDLLDSLVTMIQFVVKVPLCQLQLTVAEVGAKVILPQWQFRVSMYHGSTEELNMCWTMFVARKDIS